MRKIERLAVAAVRDNDGEMSPVIIASCSDGTLWRKDYFTEKWEELSPVPQTESEYLNLKTQL